MRRVRLFQTLIGSTEQLSNISDLDSHQGQSESFVSWHKTCKYITESIQAHGESDSDGDLEAAVFDARTAELLARFSTTNLSMWSRPVKSESGSVASEASMVRMDQPHGPHGSPLWESVKFGEFDGQTYYENRNVNQFYWELVEGARREVPFRLSYLELKAENNGFVSFGLGLFHQVKDILVRPY